MTEFDFNINTDALPKLVLNENKGRALMQHLLMVPAFKKTVLALKLTELNHFQVHHLKQKMPSWFKPDSEEDVSTLMKRLFEELPNLVVIWERISAQIDRHVFLLITAHASMEDNLVEEENKDFTHCGSYQAQIADMTAALLLGHGLAATAAKQFREPSGKAIPAELRKLFIEKIIDTALTKARTNDELVTRAVIADVIEDEIDYGKGTCYRP
jgi:hypothetical protein